MRIASYFSVPMTDAEYEKVEQRALALLDLFHYAEARMQTHFHCLDRDDD